MPRITITLDTDNSAFAPDPLTEVTRILRSLSATTDGAVFTEPGWLPLRDANGNTVGRVTVTEEGETVTLSAALLASLSNTLVRRLAEVESNIVRYREADKRGTAARRKKAARLRAELAEVEQALASR